MPRLLRIVTSANVALGIVCTILPFIPQATIDYFGTQLFREQMWNTKVALALFIVGPFMVAVGIGLLCRAHWVRAALVVMPFLQLLPFLSVHALFGGPNPFPEPMFYSIYCAVWALLALIYLFLCRQGKQFFINVSA